MLVVNILFTRKNELIGPNDEMVLTRAVDVMKLLVDVPGKKLMVDALPIFVESVERPGA